MQLDFIDSFVKGTNEGGKDYFILLERMIEDKKHYVYHNSRPNCGV